MLTLFTDLDHTLIYSHRSKPDVECVQVETLNGKAQSFITEKTLEILSALVNTKKISIIPVTTRTKEQYDRLPGLTERLCIQYAMICNGAVLLNHGQVEERWLEKSFELAKDEMNELLRACDCLKDVCGGEKVHFPYEIMTYGVSDSTYVCADMLMNKVNQEKCYIGYDSRKVYCIPKSLTKGRAVRRFRECHDVGICVAAGDSCFDVSMFHETDYAVFPKNLLSTEKSDGYFIAEDSLPLSDVLCEVLLRLSEIER